MNADDVIALNDQIAGMAKAGLPLDQGLSSVAREMNRGALRRVTQAIADDLQRGSTLPEALARRDAELPSYYSRLVTAGIRTGRLPEVLATLSNYSRSIAATKSIIADALFYPAVVMLFAAVLIAVLTIFVLPQFEQIFRDFQMRLPLPTEIALAIGRHPFLTIVLPIGAVVFGILFFWLVLRRTERGQRLWARLLYSVPIVGTLFRAARLAAFADLLAVLIEFQLPLPEAFRLAGEASSDPLMAHEALAIERHLREGHPLGEVLRGRGLLPEWVAWMAQAGESRGALAPTLQQISALYRRQVESRAAMLRSVFPAFIIIVTAGALTGAFAMAVMLPVLKLIEGLSK